MLMGNIFPEITPFVAVAETPKLMQQRNVLVSLEVRSSAAA